MSRATFHSRYAVPKNRREVTQTGHRLGDLITMIFAHGEVESLNDADDGDFCVVDLKTREKAFAVLPHGASPASIKAMIESHFDTHAFRVTEKMWLV